MTMPNSNPNVLLIMLDQVRVDTLGCYGGQVCRTPNINLLAHDGTRFNQAYTPISLCSPARASLFSGFLSHRHGMLYNTTPALYGRQDLAEGVTLLPAILREAGIRCGYAGKWHIDRSGPRAHGCEGTEVAGFGLPGSVPEYDEWLKQHGHAGQRSVPIRDYSTPDGPIDTFLPTPYGFDGVIELPTELTPPGFVAERAIDLLREMQNDRFFITASFWGPHHPALPSEEYEGTYSPAGIEPWSNFYDDLTGKPRIQQRYRDYLNPSFSTANWDTWRKTVARHYDFLTMIDAQIGRILDEVDKLGLAQNTIVVFTSDHGDTLGCHGGQFDKGPYMYEETYRVPLIMRFPTGEARGTATDALVTNMDLFATILDFVGVEGPTDSHAVSLAGIRDDPQTTFRDCIVGQFNGFDHRGMYLQRMLHTGRYKYVFNPGDFDELYDLKTDLYELHNVINEPGMRDIRRELTEKLVEEMERTGDPHARHARALMGLAATF